MRICEITEVLNNYGRASLADRLFSSYAALTSKSLYAKLTEFVQSFDDKNHELNAEEAFRFANILFATPVNELPKIEQKLYDALNNEKFLSFHQSSAARMLIRNNLFSLEYFLLLSTGGHRALSLIEVLPQLSKLGLLTESVRDYLGKSKLSFQGIAKVASIDENNLRKSLLEHSNAFALVLFDLQLERKLNAILAKPDADSIILTSMVSWIKSKGKKYAQIQAWTLDDLEDYAMRQPNGPGFYKLDLPKSMLNEPKPTLAM